jgi:thioredoxin reductase (NADPH)
MANRVTDYMQKHNTKFIKPATPTKVEKVEGKLKVTWKSGDTPVEGSDLFDTVLLAVGRKADTDQLGLDKAGVVYDPITGKIPVVHEQTNVPHIYALGDVIKGNLELTPVAIKAGRFLARRLYKGSNIYMDYVNVPTTVFTPLEYSSVGLTEEQAITHFGDENVEIYHTHYKPLEWTVAEREDNACYIKVIVNLKDSERILGIHILGPESGEIIQGFALAIRCGATKEKLDTTVGIHPTSAEELFTLNITKRSGENPLKKGC